MSLVSILELRHLRTLAALHETGSVSRAAKRVHLTQSALSHQIKALQTHYGLSIVQRRGQTVELTDAGKHLVSLAGKVLENIQATERSLAIMSQQATGSLRIALECHTCFDWLMPLMDAFRQHWPEVELDLVSGFHSDPVKLLEEGGADVVIGSEHKRRRGIIHHPLFSFEILAVLAPEHPLRTKRVLKAMDFAAETLITYPVPEDRIDLILNVLKPAGIQPQRRTAELTVAILQLVASRRGVAALPSWGIKSYVDHDYVIARRIGAHGLWSDLYASTLTETASRPYLRDFLVTAKNTCFATLDGIVPVD
ncbi:LysR family transcriptional regulator, regulator for metE and metH [Nitrosospira sp. Nsp18]|uniref:LysR family transcriptional regulator n=1 Tax=Nitrosospira sp. Nsp18 TaxID=1855334 RepID=UPI00088DC65A|nr:LysR family transcriptional regulator [Nitrosospira sp. Nsp18]SDA28261.1 LysR family transcriptional regulator, regulator for metE and metH [Nitrosospira sp. Nsp18]